MAKIRIVGDSSGYVELAAPNAAGNNTLELPASGTKLVGADANGAITVGTGASISSPATNVLTLGTNNSERVRVDSSGRVGINTSVLSSYARTLLIRGTLGLTGEGNADTDIGMGFHRSAGDTEGYIGIGDWAVNGGAEGDFGIASQNNLLLGTQNGTERARITSSGNLGIGLTDPQAKLNLSINPGTGGVVSGTTPQGIAINYNDNDGAYGGLWFSNTFGGDQGISGIAGFRTNNYQTDLRFYTNNTNSARSFTERVRIDSSGNVKLSTAGTKVLNSSGNPILQQTGSILQVVQTLKTNSFSATSTGNNVWVDITGLSATITPSSSSNKILIMYTVYSSHGSTTYGRSLRLNRNGTAIAVGDLSGSTPQATSNAYMAYNGSCVAETNQVLDSPASTSALTYKLQFSSENTNSTYYVNIPGSVTNDGRSATTVSNITLMEISG